jgi:glycosyltransferase involved in cell wall biosynthesis
MKSFRRLLRPLKRVWLFLSKIWCYWVDRASYYIWRTTRASSLRGRAEKITSDQNYEPRFSSCEGLIFILAGVPIDDTGGGSRSTQWALEFLRRNYGVVYVYKYPKWERTDLDLQLTHPNLYHIPLQQFSPGSFEQVCQQLGAKNRRLLAVVEIPFREWLPVLEYLHAFGVSIAYDMIDDWNTALGGKWYSPQFERHIARMSDFLLASAPVLVARLKRMTQRAVIYLPNAYNSRLFDSALNYACPSDFPAAEWAMIYTGALYGPWFDWELLIQAARANPQAAVVVVGDYRDQCPEPLPNLYFLGLKPQADLPAYLAHSQVAIIPWKVSQITLATSPLKLFEYLAMRKPVVAPDLPVLRDVPFVYPATSARQFITNIERARHIPVEGDALEAFLAENSWQARVDTLLSICGGGE